jgi:hypothetical protein
MLSTSLDLSDIVMVAIAFPKIPRISVSHTSTITSPTVTLKKVWAVMFSLANGGMAILKIDAFVLSIFAAEPAFISFSQLAPNQTMMSSTVAKDEPKKSAAHASWGFWRMADAVPQFGLLGASLRQFSGET